jgi:hypothetical protein
VTGIKGPLEEGWQKKVEAFANQIMPSPHTDRLTEGPGQAHPASGSTASCSRARTPRR